MGDNDVLVREDGRDGICAAYNRIIEVARNTPDCEAVVLLHDDTELFAGARDAIVAAIRTPDVGVVGVIGGRGLYDTLWLYSRERVGTANDTTGRDAPYRTEGVDADVVDGLLLVVTPAAYKTVLFDQVTFPRFHGYDTDYCLAVRDAGMRVVVAPIGYHHHDKSSLGDADAYHAAAEALRRKWPQWIRPITGVEKVTFTTSQTVGRWRHRSAVAVKRAIGAARGRR